MHHTTALHILNSLNDLGLLTVRDQMFRVEKYPMPVHLADVKEAFLALIDHFHCDRKDYFLTVGHGIEIEMREKLFEKFYTILYIKQKKTEKKRPESLEKTSILPTLFIGHEKTQVRQIPLAHERPWPFRMLLELGGMIVCKTKNRRDLLMELRQYLNNHPQYDIKVSVHDWPTGEVAIHTWWFANVPVREKRAHVNIPG
jgi:hypothetical protein